MSKSLGGASATQNVQSELEHDADHWIQCDRCSKWRRVPPNVAQAIEDDAEWYCEHNPNSAFSSCDVPQELTNEEIDQEAVAAEEERLALPKLPAVWQLLRGNYYSHRKRKQQDEDDIMVCSCPPPWRGGDGCGPNCINRMLCIECTEDFCPCEDKCNNQMFTKKQYAKLAVRRAGPKGFGLYAEEDLKAGQFLIEYIGEVLEEEEYTRRKQYYIQNGQRHFYFMNIGNGEVIDACRKGNHARFINHSCDPNCETQKWMVQGELAIGLFALRKVKAGEELTFDYNFERYGDKPMRCFCGSQRCRKFIGGTQESTADIVELGDAEDVTHDPEPVMVREEETDAVVQAMLDKEVGTIRRNWDTRMLSRLQDLCRQKGIDWSLDLGDEGRTASTQAPAAFSGLSYDQSEDEASRAAGSGRAAASPATSSVLASDAVARAELEGVESLPIRGPLKAAFKQQKRKRSTQETEADATIAAKKQQQEERRRLRLEQQEKRKARQQEGFIKMQAEAEKRFEKLKQQRLQQEGQQQQIPKKKLIKQQQQPPHELEALQGEEEELQDSGMETSEEEQEQEQQQQQPMGTQAGIGRTVDLGVGGTEEDKSQNVHSAPSHSMGAQQIGHKRVKIVQVKKRRPPLAPGTKPAAAADVGKEKKTASGKRSFLTLAVSTVGKAVKRRSEVDRRLEQLVHKQSWKLQEPGQQSVIKVLRMFNLCDITPRQADPALQQQLLQQQQPGSKQGSPVRQNSAQSQQAEQTREQSQQQLAGHPLQQGLAGQLEQQKQQLNAAAAAASGEGAAADDQLGQSQLPQSLMPLQPLRGAELEARERESEARFKARQRARMADLGMLLDVVLASSSEKLKKEWVTCGILTQLQQTLGRLPFTAEYSTTLVKVTKVLELLPLTPDDLYTVRSAHGTFADLIRRMASSAADWEVRRRSHQLLKRYAAASCSDATLLQLYHVPGANGKPYLLSLHLPPPQIQRLLALLPKNAPPPRHQQQWIGEHRHMQGDSRGGGPVEQQSSPSSSHGPAGMASEGALAGPASQWKQQPAVEEVQYMQGNRPLGRGASSSQLASEGWEVGNPGPWGDRLLPPAPPPGATGMFRHNRHSRHMQQRSPPRNYGGWPGPIEWPAPRGFMPGIDRGPDRGRGDRGDPYFGPAEYGSIRDRGPPFGPPEGPNGAPGSWHMPFSRDRGPPGRYGYGMFDRAPAGAGYDMYFRDREWDREPDWEPDRFDRGYRDGHRQGRDREGLGASKPYLGPESAGQQHTSGWGDAPGAKHPSPLETDAVQQQQPSSMPLISDLFADGPAGPPEGMVEHGYRPPSADAVPDSSSQGWHHTDLQAGPPNEPSGYHDSHRRYVSAPCPLAQVSQHERRQGRELCRVASITELCSWGVYQSYVEPETCVGSYSPIVAGSFSPPLDDSMLSVPQLLGTPRLPEVRELAAEDVFRVLQDAVLSDRTPGVAVSTLVTPQKSVQVKQESSLHNGPGHQKSEAVGKKPLHVGGAGAGLQQLPPTQEGLSNNAVGAVPVVHTAQWQQQASLPQQQQQQEYSDCWEHPGPEFESFVSEAVKRRLGKYVQPDHPSRISKEDAQMLFRKLRREVVEKELTAFAARQAQGQIRPIGKVEVEVKIKDFVRQSIRRLHASRAAGGIDGLAAS